MLAGHGHIKQRLIKAYEENLDEISEDELPSALQEPFAELKHQMYRVTPLNGEGAICASVRKMSVHEASECAATVVALYGEIAPQKSRAKRTRTADQDQQVSVPPFLVKTN